MKQEQQQQAQSLYFQTDLSKSEIATMLGISRSTLHSWVRDYNWDHIKKSALHIPSQLAENCYFIMARMQEDILSEERRDKPATYQEVNALYKLTLTASKLKTRNLLNETLELGAHFIEFVDHQSPAAADFIKPYIDGYIVSRAASASSTQTEQDDLEARLDLEDLRYWAENPSEAPIAGAAENKTAAQRSPNIEHQTLSYPGRTQAQIQTAISSPTSKNQPHLNRAQRRQLARSRAAA